MTVAVTTAESVDLEQLAVAQSNCPSVAQLRNSSSLAVQSTPVSQQLLWCDPSSGQQQLLVPLLWQKKVFPCCTLSCPPRHQSFQTTSIFKVCVERHGCRCRPVVPRMCSLLKSQNHNSANSSHPSNPHSRPPLHSPPLGPGGPSDGQL